MASPCIGTFFSWYRTRGKKLNQMQEGMDVTGCELEKQNIWLLFWKDWIRNKKISVYAYFPAQIDTQMAHIYTKSGFPARFRRFGQNLYLPKISKRSYSDILLELQKHCRNCPNCQNILDFWISSDGNCNCNVPYQDLLFILPG